MTIRAMAVGLMACLVLPLGAGATPIEELVIFGDSLSDAGNLLLASSADPNLRPDPPPPYFGGRQSNGPIWTEYLASELGTPQPQPSLAGGSNYAYAGAVNGSGFRDRTSLVYRDLDGNTTTNDPQRQSVPKIGTQIDSYLGDRSAFSDNQLVILWAGANDLLDMMQDAGTGALNLADPAAVSARMNQIITVNLGAHLQSLENAGATRILVPNQVDASRAPIWSNPVSPLASPQNQAAMHQLVLLFNDRLNALLGEIDADPGFAADIIPVDMFGAFDALLDDPTAFGLSNTTDPALLTGIPADGFLFWDLIHPTTEVHHLIADTARQSIAVPEPPVWLLLGAGLLFYRRSASPA